MKNIRLRVALGSFIVLSVLTVLFLSISEENITYYQTVGEVLKTPEKFSGQDIRVMGLVQPGTTEWNAQNLTLSFQITEDGKNFLTVNYQGVKPDMFREGQGVVAEGYVEKDSEFKASTLLVKHSEEYKAPDEGELRKKYYESLNQEISS